MRWDIKPKGIQLQNFNKWATALVWMALGSAPDAQADQRRYVWTYEYQTVERGAAEFESYFTIVAPDLQRMSGSNSAEHQFELEIGMTDRFDFAIYQVFAQAAGEDLEYEGFKLRSRNRFGEKGRAFVDPLFYFEYAGEPNFLEHALEFKLILAKDFGARKSWNLALNPTFEMEKEGAEEWEYAPKYAAGLRHDLGALFCFGLEARGSEKSHYLGPVIAHGREGIWMALGTLFKIADTEAGQPEFLLRMLLGVGLD